MSDPFWPFFGAMLVVTGVLAIGARECNKRWPEQFDETTWPCERFKDRTIERVPARCFKNYGAPMPSNSTETTQGERK